MAPIPTSTSAVPVDASTMRVYVLLPLGYAITGSEQSMALKFWYASSASPVIVPDLYVASFLVALFNGAHSLAKSFTHVLKKLQSPTKDLISSFVSGIFAFSTAFSLSFPGVIL